MTNTSLTVEIEGKVSRLRSALHGVFISSFEMVPLMVFILIRAFSIEMPARILTGGALSVVVFSAWSFKRVRLSPPYFSTNLFFVFASVVLMLPFPSLSTFFLELGEVGMFVCILLVSLIWHFVSPNGVLESTGDRPKYKIHSWCVLVVMTLCPFIAMYFKGNENLAGGLPFILIIISEKISAYVQAKRR